MPLGPGQSSSYVHNIIRREQEGSSVQLPSVAWTRHFQKLIGSVLVNPSSVPTSALALRYCAAPAAQHLLAVSDEDGYVSILDCASELPGELLIGDGDWVRASAQWQAHKNAVFCLEWVQGYRKILTGSGDHALRVWDALSATLVSQFDGHSGTVKAASCHPVCSNIFASGGRDGNVMIWDERLPGRPCQYAGGPMPAVVQLKGAQVRIEVNAPGPPTVPDADKSRCRSITSVQFMKLSNLLAVASDSSNTVQLWDVRKLNEPLSGLEQPFAADGDVPQLNAVPLTSSLHYRAPKGVIKVCEDPQGLWTMVFRTDGTLQLYDSLRLDCGVPCATHLRTPTSVSFYSDATFTADSKYVVAGSSNGRLSMFEVAQPGMPPVRLGTRCHTREITALAASHADANVLCSACEDARICVWDAGARREHCLLDDMCPSGHALWAPLEALSGPLCPAEAPPTCEAPGQKSPRSPLQSRRADETLALDDLERALPSHMPEASTSAAPDAETASEALLCPAERAEESPAAAAAPTLPQHAAPAWARKATITEAQFAAVASRSNSFVAHLGSPVLMTDSRAGASGRSIHSAPPRVQSTRVLQPADARGATLRTGGTAANALGSMEPRMGRRTQGNAHSENLLQQQLANRQALRTLCASNTAHTHLCRSSPAQTGQQPATAAPRSAVQELLSHQHSAAAAPALQRGPERAHRSRQAECFLPPILEAEHPGDTRSAVGAKSAEPHEAALTRTSSNCRRQDPALADPAAPAVDAAPAQASKRGSKRPREDVPRAAGPGALHDQAGRKAARSGPQTVRGGRGRQRQTEGDASVPKPSAHPPGTPASATCRVRASELPSMMTAENFVLSPCHELDALSRSAPPVARKSNQSRHPHKTDPSSMQSSAAAALMSPRLGSAATCAGPDDLGASGARRAAREPPRGHQGSLTQRRSEASTRCAESGTPLAPLQQQQQRATPRLPGTLQRQDTAKDKLPSPALAGSGQRRLEILRSPGGKRARLVCSPGVPCAPGSGGALAALATRQLHRAGTTPAVIPAACRPHAATVSATFNPPPQPGSAPLCAFPATNRRRRRIRPTPVNGPEAHYWQHGM